ncbi:hypothetical protein FRC11_013707 [Ceratobasidium sp. 423]|nr:hypothetical protein FRC11_013707 [Ceratobasidium sp. 423]
MATGGHPFIQADRANVTTDQVPWEDAAARKRDDRASRLKPYAHWSLADLIPPSSQKNIIPLTHARLTDRERSFLAYDATDLAHRLATRECAAYEVTTAFCKAAYAAQELTNCITEVMFTQAQARARELDAHLQETGKVVGPLHGVPVSIKDHISVKGEDTACGYIAWAGRTIAEDDATIVHILRAAGAVIYVKTTNPQSLFSLETTSNIYGDTLNPHNRNLISGGSSGGEGALIACRASLLGVGTDIGGSIVCPFQRLPSAWCGLYGLKPSSHRLPSSGLNWSYKGKEDINVVVGPMAHSVRDLDLFCRVVSAYEPWNIDFTTLSMPWNHSLTQVGGSDKLVIGIFSDDGIVTPHPPIVKSLKKAREALVAAGHEVIDWIPMDHKYASQLGGKMYMLDGGEDIRRTLAESGEPPIPMVAQILDRGEKQGGSTLAESWALNVQRDQFRARALKHWNETALRSKSGRPVDAILCPVAATLAPPRGRAKRVGYASYWNLLDLPTAVLPSGKPFDASKWRPTSTPSMPQNSIEEDISRQWDPAIYDGAPICLQLVGRRWQEEKLIATLRVVDEVLRQSEKNF